MELARLASRFGLTELPELVRMEREIEVLEEKRLREQSGRPPQLWTSSSIADLTVDASSYASRVFKTSTTSTTCSDGLRTPRAITTSENDLVGTAGDDTYDEQTSRSTIMVDVAADCGVLENAEPLENAKQSSTLKDSVTSTATDTFPSEVGRLNAFVCSSVSCVINALRFIEKTPTLLLGIIK